MRRDVRGSTPTEWLDYARSDLELASIEPPPGVKFDALCYHMPAERRSEIFGKLRDSGIGVNVHYIPVHLHPYYRKHFGTGPGLCPVAEAGYEQLLSLPMYPALEDSEIESVIAKVNKAVA